MRYKLLFFLFLFFFQSSFAENIAFLKQLKKNDEKQIFRHNIEEVIESFNDRPIILNYLNIVNWNLLKDADDATKEKEIYNTLKKFFKKNHIRKLIIGGDDYNYNEPPFHPEPRERFFFTKVLTKMIQRKEIRVFAICGGMQGILYFNDIKLNSLKNILKRESKEYQSGAKYLNSNEERFFYDKKQFRSCGSPLNEVRIIQESYLGSLMIQSEKKYKIKYPRDNDNSLIAHVAFAHFHAVDNSPHNLEKLKQKNFKIVGLSQDNIVYIVEDEHHNILIEGHPELVANINRCPQEFSKEDVIFSRLLFNNLLKKSKRV